MTMNNMKHAKRGISRFRSWIIFGVIFTLVLGLLPILINNFTQNAFAEDDTLASEPAVADVEADPNVDCAVTISATGEGKIESTSELSFNVPSGTSFSIYGNELTISDKKFIATVNTGYCFSGWFINSSFMPIYGTITADATINAKFTDDSTSCTINGQVTWDGEPYHWAFVRVVSESYPAIVASTHTEGGNFSLKIPRNSRVYICSYQNLRTGYSPLLTEAETSGESYTLTDPIALLAEDPVNCLLTGKFTSGGGIKDAGVIYLWDENQTGRYDFRTNTVYTNNDGTFYCMGKHATDAYVLYFGPGICMSTRRVSAAETQRPQYTASWNIKAQGNPVYLSVTDASKYTYDLNLATLDCADVINLNFKDTINLGLASNTQVKFSGDTYSYLQHDDVDPWRASNGIDLKYSITAKPATGYSFKGWLVNGQPVSDGSMITINSQTVISADVVQNITINGHVNDVAYDSPIPDCDVFFVSSDYSHTYAYSVSDSSGNFVWNLPAGISGKVLAYKKGYVPYEQDYTTASGPLTIDMTTAGPVLVNYYVKGRITENDGTTPIPGVFVSYYTANKQYYTITGTDGSYVFDLDNNHLDGFLVTYKDLYMSTFNHLEWTDLGQWYIEKNLKLTKYTESQAAFFGMSDYQKSYDLSLYYNDQYIASETYTKPFTLYFSDFSLYEDGETLYLNDLNGSGSGFSYKVTASPVDDSYIFQEWEIKQPNALFSSTDIKPVYVASVTPDPEPGSEGTAQTGDDNFILIAILIGVIILACGTIAVAYFVKRKNSKPKHNAKHI